MPSRETEELCLGLTSGVVSNAFENVAFQKQFFIKEKKKKGKKIMPFLVAVTEKEFPVSVGNTEISEISSGSGMFPILYSEDSKSKLCFQV